MEPDGAVVVTGCSSGIGEATAIRLAAEGWTVYATARRVDAVAHLADRGCRLLPLDVTDEGTMAAAVSAVEAEHGAVAALVNNAGYSQSGAVEAVPLELARRQLETNVLGLARLTQLVLPGMRRRRAGRVVNISSMGGRLTFPGGGWYHASKYALEALSDALRYEVAGFGVQVVVVEPGLIRSRFADTAVGSLPADPGEGAAYAGFTEAVAQATRDSYAGLLGRLGGGPETVAAVVVEALAAKRPKTRYRVTPSAHLLLGLRAALPDRAWDAFLRRSFPSPG